MEKGIKGKIVGLLVVGLIFCNTITAYAKKTVIKIGTPDPVANITMTKVDPGALSSIHTAALVFKRVVELKTDGRIEVKIFPNNQLGAEAETFQTMQSGIIQGTLTTASTLAVFLPEWMAFSVPYAYASPEIAMRLMSGPVGEKFTNLSVEKIGIRPLAWAHIGYRNFTNNVRSIKSPADMKGLKIRVIQSPDMVKMVESFGAHATPIPWSELYAALQQGVVDGEENPVSMMEVAKLYEVQKYITMDGHRLGFVPFCINEKFYQALSPEDRVIVKDAATQAMVAYRGIIEFAEPLLLDYLTEKGMQSYSPNQKEMAEFKSKAQDAVIPWIKKEIGNEWVDEVLSEVKKIEEEYYRD